MLTSSRHWREAFVLPFHQTSWGKAFSSLCFYSAVHFPEGWSGPETDIFGEDETALFLYDLGKRKFTYKYDFVAVSDYLPPTRSWNSLLLPVSGTASLVHTAVISFWTAVSSGFFSFFSFCLFLSRASGIILTRYNSDFLFHLVKILPWFLLHLKENPNVLLLSIRPGIILSIYPSIPHGLLCSGHNELCSVS